MNFSGPENLKGRRVLVTGASGFIGANLSRGLLRMGSEVVAVARPGTDLWRIADLNPGIDLCYSDLSDQADLKRIVSGIRPETIFHLALPLTHAMLPEERIELLKTGVLGTANLLEAVSSIEIQRFVHLGSSLEYDKRDNPLKESDCIGPATFRGVVKAASTLLCQQFARQYNRPIVVLRPFSVYGYWEHHTRLIPTAIMAALCGREIDLTATGFRRDLVFVEDLVEACILAASSDKTDGEIINIGAGSQWANEEVVDMIQSLSGKRIKMRIGAYPPRPSDTTSPLADIQKARQLLGWEPRHDIKAGLEKTISWFKDHLDVYKKRIQ